MVRGVREINDLIIQARDKARKETGSDTDATVVVSVDWPVQCTVGPGLEGAIACESKVGYVNGTTGTLSYRGFDIFDLCAKSTYEEVSYLLLKGSLPTSNQLEAFKKKLITGMNIPGTLRDLMGFDIESMNSMAALRLGINMMRRVQTDLDKESGKPASGSAISLDEDSIPMETPPKGEEHAIYEFKRDKPPSAEYETCCHLISGVASIAAAIARMHDNELPITPDPDLGFAANYLYMSTGTRPTAEQERILDVLLILQADHGINASTFASLVVASTLSDLHASVSAGIGALTGPLHGGANEEVVRMLRRIGSVDNVKPWYEKARRKKMKIMGVGHRVYKAYDPRARVLAPIAKYMAAKDPETRQQFKIAVALEKEIVASLGKKGLFPNVDYYSGMVYSALGISDRMFTPMFAVSRVAGWTARILEYLGNNRIFRPRVMYSGPVGCEYVPIKKRARRRR